MSYVGYTIDIKFIQQNTMINGVKGLLEINKYPNSTFSQTHHLPTRGPGKSNMSESTDTTSVKWEWSQPRYRETNHWKANINITHISHGTRRIAGRLLIFMYNTEKLSESMFLPDQFVEQLSSE